MMPAEEVGTFCFLVVLVVALILVLMRGFYNKQRGKKLLPPGPRFALPFFGHLPLLGASPHQRLLKWTKVYGPIISVQLGSFPAVIINNGKLIKEVLSSPLLMGRPRIKVFDAYSRRQGISLADGPFALEQRQYAQRLLKALMTSNIGTGGGSIVTAMSNESEDFVLQMERRTGQALSIHQLFNRHVVNSLLSVLIDKRYEEGDEELEQLARILAGTAQNSGCGAVLGMYIPRLCDWFPNATGYRKWVSLGDNLREFFRPIIAEHKANHVPAQPRDLLHMYLDKMIESQGKGTSFLSEEYLVDTLKDFFTAGMETTSIALEWLCYFMAKHPEKQAKLAAEIDCKLGDRIPGVNDRKILHYAEAVIQETLRLGSVHPFALFHSALENVEVAGYRVPKDTLVIANVYGAHRDPDIWPDPEEFRPERFINEKGDFSATAGSGVTVSFGAGRRSCIGEQVARSNIFLFTVRMLQNFMIKAAGPMHEGHKFSLTTAPPNVLVVFDRR